jgi:hypothetical protein
MGSFSRSAKSKSLIFYPSINHNAFQDDEIGAYFESKILVRCLIRSTKNSKFRIFVNLFLFDLPALQLTNNHQPFIKREASLRNLQQATTGHCYDEENCNQISKNLLYLTIPNIPMPSCLKAKP